MKLRLLLESVMILIREIENYENLNLKEKYTLFIDYYLNN